MNFDKNNIDIERENNFENNEEDAINIFEIDKINNSTNDNHKKEKIIKSNMRSGTIFVWNALIIINKLYK